MDLLSLLRPQGAQAPGSMSQPRQSGLSLLLGSPEALMAMAGPLMGNQGNAANFGNAMTAGALGIGRQRELQAQTAQDNKTYEFFKTQAPEFAQMIDAGMPVNQVWSEYTKQRYAQNSGAEVYGTPIYGVDSKTGKEGVGVIGKDGNFRLLDTGGFNVARGVQMNDTGTGFVPTSKSTGQVVGPTLPIDNAGAAADKAEGTGIGQDRALFDSMSSKMPGLEHVITELDKLAESATYTWGGQAVDAGMKQLGMDPRQAAVDRTRYIATVDNQVLPMLRDTFGAAFTVAEGETLRATLGDPNKSPKEKQAVLKAFIEQKRRDVQAMAYRTGQATPPPQGAPQGGADPLGIR
jgi:hypothetical protein